MSSPTPEFEQHHAEDIFVVEQRPGDTFFAFVLALTAFLLLSQIGEQTKWIKGLDLLQQPRFWPALCLIGMSIFATGYLATSMIERNRQGLYPFFPTEELLNWVRPVEYVAYFMLYVFAVPFLGYLPATILLCPLLCLRAGYRDGKILLLSVIVAVVIVVVFKTMLQVKIPGGQAYDLLPAAMRNFMIINL